jgi:formyltetrahydrofolate-dependent phosphoribosylglycinamide formyltransferase
MSDSESTPNSWLSSVEDVRAWRDELDAAGKKVVFTNGVFDILHAGHVRYLREARELGDGLVIAMNSDASTRALKGPTRPVNHQEDRAEVLAALGCVDRVVLFEDPRATGLIRAIRPHVYSKGGDYTVESLNAEERAALDEVGAEIRILPLVPGRSTTATIKRMSLPESKKLKLGILGSGHGSNFEAIWKAIESGALDAEISVVLSDAKDSRILEKAREAGLPAIFVDPGEHPLRLPSGPQKEILDHLDRHNVQVVVLAGFMRLLKEPVLSAYRNRIVNIHPSLLPKYKGREAWVQALEAGETESGCTVHLVNEDLDGGQILAQQSVPILPDDTAETLLARVHEAEHLLLPKVLAEWRERGLAVG